MHLCGPISDRVHVPSIAVNFGDQFLTRHYLQRLCSPVQIPDTFSFSNHYSFQGTVWTKRTSTLILIGCELLLQLGVHTEMSTNCLDEISTYTCMNIEEEYMRDKAWA